MNKYEQARARLVEIGLLHAQTWNGELDPQERALERYEARERAGFRNPSTGSWCAAGLTAAMEDSGLVVPAAGTPARRGAVALLDWVQDLKHSSLVADLRLQDAQPGDIIAWLQHLPQSATAWRYVDGKSHLFLGPSPRSVCTLVTRAKASGPRGARCSACTWYTRQGHVALIVAVDDESITTVGWNEGAAPGRVMERRLWRSANRDCEFCGGEGLGYGRRKCGACGGRKLVPRSSTVLYRRPGGIYGIARPVAR